MQEQQEAVLIAAFRQMHQEDRALIIEYARARAAAHTKSQPTLQLVVSNLSPASRPTLGRASG
jgi:hypothetical protein